MNPPPAATPSRTSPSMRFGAACLVIAIGVLAADVALRASAAAARPVAAKPSPRR